MMFQPISEWFVHTFGEWDWWYVFGLIGQVVFAGRFAVQWAVSEKKKQSVIPIHFWYMSLTGSVMLLAYGLHRHDPVFILAYMFNSLIYVRNLMFVHKKKPVEQNTLSIK
jgi:lipid-A-disaccharide synthase-like uncharacterized protein